VRLTAKSEYGLLAMIDLACRYGGGPISSREISERQGIPARFLEQLLVSLRRADVVHAVRGARGGFQLARDPSEVTVLDIVEALEGHLETSVCDSAGICEKSDSCAASDVWSEASSALRDVFERTTLADLARRQSRLDAAARS
jgi:Rrf2 family cysteine metabolism transcriptional repressor